MNDSIYIDDINDVSGWCDSNYEKGFSKYFKGIRELSKRLSSNSRPITDNELQHILIDLPMALFDASEALSKLYLALEVIKLKSKEEECQFVKTSTAKTITERKDEAAVQMTETKVLMIAYQTLISRVENEISLSKELIMGAKKVWDSRRRTEESNPVNPIDPDKKQDINRLPDYKTPIFGGID